MPNYFTKNKAIYYHCHFENYYIYLRLTRRVKVQVDDWICDNKYILNHWLQWCMIQMFIATLLIYMYCMISSHQGFEPLLSPRNWREIINQPEQEHIICTKWPTHEMKRKTYRIWHSLDLFGWLERKTCKKNLVCGWSGGVLLATNTRSANRGQLQILWSCKHWDPANSEDSQC